MINACSLDAEQTWGQMCSTTLKASELSKQRCSQCTIYIICIYDKPTFSSWVLQEHIQSSRFLLIKIFFPLQRPGLHPQPLNNVFHFFKHIFSLKQHCKHFNVVFSPRPGLSADSLLHWPSDTCQVQVISLAQHFHFMTGRQMKILF